MRIIYVDEAGTSAPEPVTVVVGLIIHPDTQWGLAAGLLNEALSMVPAALRNNFIFHAKTIWGAEKYRAAWPFEDRIKFLRKVMSIPFLAGLGIAWGAARRDSSPMTDNLNGLPVEKWHHMNAFGLCIGMADFYMRERCAANEIAIVVAEDLPDMRKHLRMAVGSLVHRPFNLDSLPHGWSSAGPKQILTPDKLIRVTRVVDTIHFAAKTEAALLQVADACAFGLRRYLSKQSMGVDFANSIETGGIVGSANCWADQIGIPLGIGLLFK